MDATRRGWADGARMIAVLLAELVPAGYATPRGGDRFELVHPDRLPPLPSA